MEAPGHNMKQVEGVSDIGALMVYIEPHSLTPSTLLCTHGQRFQPEGSARGLFTSLMLGHDASWDLVNARLQPYLTPAIPWAQIIFDHNVRL